MDTEDGGTVVIRSVHYSKWVWCTVPRSPRFHLYYCSTKWQIHLDVASLRQGMTTEQYISLKRKGNGCLLTLYFAEDLF